MIITNSRIPKLLSIFIDVYAITLYPFIFVKDGSNAKMIEKIGNFEFTKFKEGFEKTYNSF